MDHSLKNRNFFLFILPYLLLLVHNLMPLFRIHWHINLPFYSSLDLPLQVFRLMRKFLESTTWNCFSGEEAPYRVWTYAPGLSAEHRRWSAVCGGAGRFDASSAQLAGSRLLSVEGRQAVVLQVRTPSQGFQSYSVHGRSLASRRSRWLSAQTIHQGSAKLESVNGSEDLFFQCTKSWKLYKPWKERHQTPSLTVMFKRRSSHTETTRPFAHIDSLVSGNMYVDNIFCIYIGNCLDLPPLPDVPLSQSSKNYSPSGSWNQPVDSKVTRCKSDNGQIYTCKKGSPI